MSKKEKNQVDWTKPSWLESYGNSGSQDFFGFQFLRQTNRRLLLGRAAANQFRTAKPLLYYPAILLEFRKSNNLSPDDELPESLSAEWLRWYRIAHYLFATFNRKNHPGDLDAGYTAARQAVIRLEEKQFMSNQVFQIEPLITDLFSSRENDFGYFVQFWSGPMGYYRAVSHLPSCQVGSLGGAAYQMLSRRKEWSILTEVLRSGKMDLSTYKSLASILDIEVLDEEEVQLLHRMIFDTDRKHIDSAELYLNSFGQIAKIIETEKLIATEDSSLGYELLDLYLYRFFSKQSPVNEVELLWRLFCASYPFELGIVRLFQQMSTRFPGLTSMKSVHTELENDVRNWIKRHALADGSPKQVLHQYLKKSVVDIKSLSANLDYIASGEDGSWVEGYALGYLAWQTETPLRSFEMKSRFDQLIDSYYFFNPHSVFRFFDDSGSFLNSFTEFGVKTLGYQHQFALDRLGYGQNPKFLAVPHADLQTIEFTVNPDLIGEKEGLIGFLEGTLKFWISAKLISKEPTGQVKLLKRPPV